MPVFNCPIATCDYATDDISEALAATLLQIHGTTHAPAPAAPLAATPANHRAPKFSTRWEMFKRGIHLSPEELVNHLFQCCDEALGNAVLKCSRQTLLLLSRGMKPLSSGLSNNLR